LETFFPANLLAETMRSDDNLIYLTQLHVRSPVCTICLVVLLAASRIENWLCKQDYSATIFFLLEITILQGGSREKYLGGGLAPHHLE